MADNPTHLLIDQLDDRLRGKGSVEMAQRISEDPELAQEWQHLHMAIDAVQETGLYEQVVAMKSLWLAQQPGKSGAGFVRDRPFLSEAETDPAVRSGGSVRTMYLKAMRVAAMLLILAGGAA